MSTQTTEKTCMGLEDYNVSMIPFEIVISPEEDYDVKLVLTLVCSFPIYIGPFRSRRLSHLLPFSIHAPSTSINLSRFDHGLPTAWLDARGINHTPARRLQERRSAGGYISSIHISRTYRLALMSQQISPEPSYSRHFSAYRANSETQPTRTFWVVSPCTTTITHGLSCVVSPDTFSTSS